MARFDIFDGAKGKGFLLDCQADFLSDLESRVVVPLLPAVNLPIATRLNPIFEIDQARYVMATHLIFAIPNNRLGAAVANVAQQRDEIMSALDMLLTGF